MPVPVEVVDQITTHDVEVVHLDARMGGQGMVVDFDTFSGWHDALQRLKPATVVTADVNDEGHDAIGWLLIFHFEGMLFRFASLPEDYALAGSSNTAMMQEPFGLTDWGFVEQDLDVDDEDWESSDDEAWATDYLERDYKALPAELRRIVDEVIERPDYEGWDEHVIRANYDVPANRFDKVAEAAAGMFRSRVAPRLNEEARTVLAAVVARDDYHPAATHNSVHPMIEEEIERLGADPRCAGRHIDHSVEAEFGMDYASREKAAESLRRELAKAYVETLDQKARDQYGFTTRRNLRGEYLQPLFERYPEVLHDRIDSLVRQIDNDEHALSRERRFLAAADTLIDAGETRSGTCRTLGISNSVLDRLYRDHDVDRHLITPDDWLHDLLSARGLA